MTDDDDYYGDSRVVVHFGRYYAPAGDQSKARRHSVSLTAQDFHDLKPTQCRQWTWWDKLVHTLTGHVTERVYQDRMLRMAERDARRQGH